MEGSEVMKYNKKEWEPWIRLVKYNDVQWAIGYTPEKYKPLVALALSVAKWSREVSMNEGSDTKLCGLCVLYSGGDNYCYRSGGVECKCPLIAMGEGCFSLGSKFSDWASVTDRATEPQLVPSMRNLLLQVYEAEYKKVIG